MVLEELDVGERANPRLEGGLHLVAGGVCGVYDAPVSMSALAGEVVAPAADGLVVAGELDTLVEQPADAFGSAFHDHANRFPVAQTRACLEGVLDVGLH